MLGIHDDLASFRRNLGFQTSKVKVTELENVWVQLATECTSISHLVSKCVHATKHPTRMYNMLCCIRTTAELTAALNTDQNCHGKTHQKHTHTLLNTPAHSNHDAKGTISSYHCYNIYNSITSPIPYTTNIHTTTTTTSCSLC